MTNSLPDSTPGRSSAFYDAEIPTADQFFDATRTLTRLWDLPQHPFCRRWAAGELTQHEVATLASQNLYAVAGLATLMSKAASQAAGRLSEELEARARTEMACARQWRMTCALTSRGHAGPSIETARCAAIWLGADDAPLERRLAVLFVVLSTRARLREHAIVAGAPTDGLTPDPAQPFRHALTPLLAVADLPYLLGEAGEALVAQWEMFAGVERACAPPE